MTSSAYVFDQELTPSLARSTRSEKMRLKVGAQCATDRSCMTPRMFETRCLRLPAATKVVQWEGTSVFKVGGKMFAISGGYTASSGGYMFKASNMA